ncbi:DUF1398 domain-containing protein [Methyloradius palustris]|uniref:DUF1398 domain-containing protein n=1 Tax=Methyloradius palustris TaxID=2778876 RepID=A0A8D5GA70_9PROT|nr:DUF1398 family protein [Methyloradius palustris]BCM24481.1 hypothetical protein ZMTM_07400 [Methyloradius palustris]
MDTTVRDIIENSARQSYEGSIHFGQVIGNLMNAGVESYFADYRSPSTTYYLPSDENIRLILKVPQLKIAHVFDKEAIQNAIRGAQRGEVKYPQFLELSMQAGCIGYFVWITGRHVTYYGRNGETHIEPFPDANCRLSS